jgi:hypothetical protein
MRGLRFCPSCGRLAHLTAPFWDPTRAPACRTCNKFAASIDVAERESLESFEHYTGRSPKQARTVAIERHPAKGTLPPPLFWDDYFDADDNFDPLEGDDL